MKPGRSFAVGDRVRVRCVNSARTSGNEEYNSFELSYIQGTVKAIMKDKNGNTVIRVKNDKEQWGDSLVPPQHCIRLSRKEKPPRVEKWVSGFATAESSIWCHSTPTGLSSPVKLTEIREGESLCPAGSVAVNREALERAWDKNGSNKCIYPLHENSEFFEMFCKALGIEKWE